MIGEVKMNVVDRARFASETVKKYLKKHPEYKVTNITYFGKGNKDFDDVNNPPKNKNNIEEAWFEVVHPDRMAAGIRIVGKDTVVKVDRKHPNLYGALGEALNVNPLYYARRRRL